MRRWMGVSAAVGSATVAAVTGSAWAGTTAGAVPVQRPPSSAAHRCGHADTIAVTPGRAGDGGGESLVVQAVDGPGDPVEAAFDGTTVRVSFVRQRTGSASPAEGRVAGTAAGEGSAVLRTVLPAASRPRTYAVRAVATFDDGITACSVVTEVVVPPQR